MSEQWFSMILEDVALGLHTWTRELLLVSKETGGVQEDGRPYPIGVDQS